MIKILLFISLALLFYSIFIGEYPENSKLNFFIANAVQCGSAIGMFVFTAFLFKTPLVGIPWAILGWFLPKWLLEIKENKEHKRLQLLARDFITSASGLYASGQTTSDVVRTMADRFPEPFASEFEDMISKRNMIQNVSYPRLFKEMADKYGLEEFYAVSEILAAADRLGGPTAASKGLKRLGYALRQKERLATERAKAMMEPKIASYVVIFILLIGMLCDATVFKQMFNGGTGKIVLTMSSILLVGLIFMTKRINTSKDL